MEEAGASVMKPQGYETTSKVLGPPETDLSVMDPTLKG